MKTTTEYRIEWYANSNPDDFTIGCGIFDSHDAAVAGAMHKISMGVKPRDTYRIISFEKGTVKKTSTND